MDEFEVICGQQSEERKKLERYLKRLKRKDKLKTHVKAGAELCADGILMLLRLVGLVILKIISKIAHFFIACTGVILLFELFEKGFSAAFSSAVFTVFAVAAVVELVSTLLMCFLLE